MSEQEIKQEEYFCSKFDTNVIITRIVLLHRSSSTGEIDKRITTSLDCDQKSNCGVGITSGLSTSFDYKKCVHPEIKQ